MVRSSAICKLLLLDFSLRHAHVYDVLLPRLVVYLAPGHSGKLICSLMCEYAISCLRIKVIVRPWHRSYQPTTASGSYGGHANMPHLWALPKSERGGDILVASATGAVSMGLAFQ